MAVDCDFEVAFEIHDGITSTILGDLNDRANGLTVGVPYTEEDDELRRVIATSPFVAGDFEVIGTPAAGVLEVVLNVDGATWVEMMTRYRSARAWWRQSSTFHLDVTLEGDTLRYLARRPDVSPGRIEPDNLQRHKRSFVLSFPVQPNPVVI